MKLKLMLSTTAAVALLSGAAMAGDNNNAVMTQEGDGGGNNTITVNQIGAHDSTAGDPSAISRWLTQYGANNTMGITQIEGHNAVGTGGTDPNYDGVEQTGSAGNYLNIVQGNTSAASTSAGTGHNTVGVVQQYSDYGTPGPVNKATVSQDNNDTVDFIEQIYTGGGTNQVSITELNGHNDINAVSQTGGGNIASIYLNNTGSNTNGGAGGFDTLSASGAAAGTLNPALSSAVNHLVSTTGFAIPQGTATQEGSNNQLYFTGNTTGAKFGFYQQGDNHLASGSMGGSDNDLAVMQQDSGNIASFTVGGNRNDVGMLQFGDGNVSNAVTSGDDNHVGLLQINVGGATNNATAIVGGNSNIVAGIQIGYGGANTSTANVSGDSNIVGTFQAAVGGTNTASLNVSGSANVAAVAQLGTGGGVNSATVTIAGSNNNALGSSFASGDSAGAVASPTGSIGDALGPTYSAYLNTLVGSGLGGAVESLPVLSPGLITQIGGDNSLAMNVKVGADNNLFSTYQNGSGHSINSTISGDGNELAIAQLNGTDSSATTNQTGAGNSIGVGQIGSFNVANVTQ